MKEVMKENDGIQNFETKEKNNEKHKHIDDRLILNMYNNTEAGI